MPMKLTSLKWLKGIIDKDKHQIYEAVVFEIFNNNFGESEEEVDNIDEEVKGASGLLRGLESKGGLQKKLSLLVEF